MRLLTMRLLFHESHKIPVVNNRYVPENDGICPGGTREKRGIVNG